MENININGKETRLKTEESYAAHRPRNLFLFKVESADFNTMEFKTIYVLAENENDAKTMGGEPYGLIPGKVERVETLKIFGWGDNNFNRI